MSKQIDLLKLSNLRGFYIDKKGNLFNKWNKEVKLSLNNKNYFCFNITFNNSVTRCPAHRLQAYQKYGDKLFEEGIVVRHLDGNSLNNSWDNIAIGTNSDNQMDIPKEKRILRASNPIYNHLDIINDRSKGFTYSELMEKYNIKSKGTISFIINKSLALQNK